MARRNVVLTGFMATGKSSVGRALADRIGYKWVDTDALIESRHGAIADIFEKRGEAAFRMLEREIAGELGTLTGRVISTGGGMLLDPDNERSLCDSARVFCLQASPEEILRRVEAQDDQERPLLAAGDPLRRIGEVLAARADVYSRFEQVPTDGRSVDAIVTDIVSRLEEPQSGGIRLSGSPHPI